jgi:hypothetical protein
MSPVFPKNRTQREATTMSINRLARAGLLAVSLFDLPTGKEVDIEIIPLWKTKVHDPAFRGTRLSFGPTWSSFDQLTAPDRQLAVFRERARDTGKTCGLEKPSGPKRLQCHHAFRPAPLLWNGCSSFAGIDLVTMRVCRPPRASTA